MSPPRLPRMPQLTRNSPSLRAIFTTPRPAHTKNFLHFPRNIQQTSGVHAPRSHSVTTTIRKTRRRKRWLGSQKRRATRCCSEYVLFWTAQTKRVLKRNAEALADLNTIQREYPNTAIKEQVLDALAVTAVETGHAQDAIDALTAYSGTATKPALLLDRAHAYQIAGQTVRAAKDYQDDLLQISAQRRSKSRRHRASSATKDRCAANFLTPRAEMQEQRAQALFDAHKWRDARAEFEKLVAECYRTPRNPTRQRAQLRVAQCRMQLQGLDERCSPRSSRPIRKWTPSDSLPFRNFSARRKMSRRCSPPSTSSPRNIPTEQMVRRRLHAGG